MSIGGISWSMPRTACSSAATAGTPSRTASPPWRGTSPADSRSTSRRGAEAAGQVGGGAGLGADAEGPRERLPGQAVVAGLLRQQADALPGEGGGAGVRAIVAGVQVEEPHPGPGALGGAVALA